jgi:hypothetical protein
MLPEPAINFFEHYPLSKENSLYSNAAFLLVPFPVARTVSESGTGL